MLVGVVIEFYCVFIRLLFPRALEVEERDYRFFVIEEVGVVGFWLKLEFAFEGIIVGGLDALELLFVDGLG